jgi:hypothetical protein
MALRKETVLGVGATAIVILALILGYRQLGGRARQRDLRADAARVNDLRVLAVAIHEEWMKNQKLPGKLADVAERSESIQLRTTDPISKAPYQYAPGTGSRYELCATMAAGRREQDWPEMSRAWAHPPGRHCFALDASASPPLGVPVPYY